MGNIYDEVINFENAKEIENMIVNIRNFEDVKANIKARLYGTNKETKGIYRNAEPWGFDGLNLIPIIEIGETPEGMATMQIPKELVAEWGITEDEVYEIAIQNLDYRIRTMKEVMLSMMPVDDMPKELIDEMFPPTPFDLYVISNKNNVCGASSIIPATKELIERFPNGYIVLPSSIHEVIVVPNTDDEEIYNDMVRQVNAGIVSEDERLSDDIYKFVA
jgi:hypothetical protein